MPLCQFFVRWSRKHKIRAAKQAHADAKAAGLDGGGGGAAPSQFLSCEGPHEADEVEAAPQQAGWWQRAWQAATGGQSAGVADLVQLLWSRTHAAPGFGGPLDASLLADQSPLPRPCCVPDWSALLPGTAGRVLKWLIVLLSLATMGVCGWGIAESIYATNGLVSDFWLLVDRVRVLVSAHLPAGAHGGREARGRSGEATPHAAGAVGAWQHPRQTVPRLLAGPSLSCTVPHPPPTRSWTWKLP